MIYGFSYFVMSIAIQILALIFVHNISGVITSLFASLFLIYYNEHRYSWRDVV